MAEYIFTPTGGRVTSEKELPRPLFEPVGETKPKAAAPKPKRAATARKAKTPVKE